MQVHYAGVAHQLLPSLKIYFSLVIVMSCIGANCVQNVGTLRVAVHCRGPWG